MNVTPAEVRKARSFLYAHHRRAFGISPRLFAGAARELGVSFRELLKFIALLYARGTQAGVFRMENLRNIASRGSVQ